MNNIEHIIWDWNGTLLNDIDWSVACINQMLQTHNIQPLLTLDSYRALFGFPVKDYYQTIGFDFQKEPFEQLAEEYITLYMNENAEHISLQNGAETVLSALADKDIHQVILSASNQSHLLEQVEFFRIRQYFSSVHGVSDVYAKSKIEIGLDVIGTLDAGKTVLIGDSIHDFEVSQALGTRCILVADGHQSKERLLSCGVTVVDKLTQVTAEILN